MRTHPEASLLNSQSPQRKQGQGDETSLRRKFFILHNPNAGAAARRHYHKVVTLLSERGACLKVVQTSRHGEGQRAAAEAAASGHFDAIVAAGGDGTVHDAATGLLGADVPLGIIPTGTANVFAREIGLPHSAEAMARTLQGGSVKTIPVGEVNGQPFLFVVGIGFDAEAVRRFETAGTRKFGQAGFVPPLLHALWSEQNQSLQITTDHGKSKAEWVIVTRARRYAGGFILCKEADLIQTNFHVLRFAGRSPLIRIRQLAALASGLIRFDPDVSIEVASWVQVEGNSTVPVQVDGEVLGALPVGIQLHPERLQLLVPQMS
jgi:diacylglycerol kinase (ATP)